MLSRSRLQSRNEVNTDI